MCSVQSGQVILGWDIGISTMRRNELARFLVKSSYAYGDLGCPPRIPPKATSNPLCVYNA